MEKTKFSFISSPDKDELNQLKRLISARVFFLKTPKDFADYLKKQIKYGDIRAQFPYLVFCDFKKKNLWVRIRRYNKQLENKYNEEFSGKYPNEQVKVAHFIHDPFSLKQDEIIHLTTNYNHEFLKLLSNQNNIFKENDNSQANGKNKGFSICHIGGGTAHSLNFFAAIPNIVILPNWLSSATDCLPEIRLFLAAKSYDLFYPVLEEHWYKNARPTEQPEIKTKIDNLFKSLLTSELPKKKVNDPEPNLAVDEITEKFNLIQNPANRKEILGNFNWSCLSRIIAFKETPPQIEHR